MGSPGLSSACGRWLRRLVPAALITVAGFAHAQADPRIDQDTASVAAGVIEQQGVASWYGKHWRGRKTASGIRFDDRLLTAASLSLPLATLAHVTNLQNGRSVDVVVNDRGPYIQGRIMDLSAAAASALGMRNSGVAQVAIKVQFAPAG